MGLIDYDKLAKVIERLHGAASQRTWEDHEEYDVNGCAGGNIDDAYEGGKTSGEAELAREVLDLLGLPWKKPESDEDE